MNIAFPIPHQLAIRETTASSPAHHTRRVQALESWVANQAHQRNIPALNNPTITLRVIPSNSRPVPNHTPMLTAAVMGLIRAGVLTETQLAAEDTFAHISATNPDAHNLMFRFYLLIEGDAA